jgi:hypothetical protein
VRKVDIVFDPNPPSCVTPDSDLKHVELL